MYQNFFNTNDFDDIIEAFHETIIDTNRSYNFFVDWEKIERNIKQYKVELNILNSLIGSKNFNEDLKYIISNYPKVISVIPILIAVRDKKLKVINDFENNDLEIIEYDFTKQEISHNEIDKLVMFFEKTGLRYFLKELCDRSLVDYVIGVETGMDTHARKNRSGNSMEQLLKPIIQKIGNKGNYTVLFQKKFAYLEKKYNFEVKSNIKNRKADFIIIKDQNKVINIEVNFYSGTGSKPQEIVDSYINRQSELKENGFKFIWITDGDGWQGQKNQIRKGF